MDEAFILDQQAQSADNQEDTVEISHQVIDATSLYLKEIGYAPLLTARGHSVVAGVGHTRRTRQACSAWPEVRTASNKRLKCGPESK